LVIYFGTRFSVSYKNRISLKDYLQEKKRTETTKIFKVAVDYFGDVSKKMLENRSPRVSKGVDG